MKRTLLGLLGLGALVVILKWGRRNEFIYEEPIAMYSTSSGVWARFPGQKSLVQIKGAI